MFTILAPILAKLLSTLVGGIVEPLIKHWSNKDTQFAKIMVESLRTEGEIRKAGAQARVGMMNTGMGRALMAIVIGPAGLYIGSIYLVTLIESLTGVRFEIQAVPERYEDYAISLLQVFIGAGGAVGAASVATRNWFRK